MKKQTEESAKKEDIVIKRFFLIGMMGAGKTYWANQLKKKIKIPAYDLDSMVEIIEEKSVAEMFNQDGEAFFRKAETKMLHLFAEKKQCIVACGGGTPCFNNNMDWMNKNGTTIWLDEPIEILADRLNKEIEKRPLLHSTSANTLTLYLHEKLIERKPFYQQATHHLYGDKITLKNLQQIINQHV